MLRGDAHTKRSDEFEMIVFCIVQEDMRVEGWEGTREKESERELRKIKILFRRPPLILRAQNIAGKRYLLFTYNFLLPSPITPCPFS